MAFSMLEAMPIPLTDVDWFNQAIRAGTARALEHDFAVVVGPPTLQPEVWFRVPMDGIVIFDPVSGDPVLSRLRRRGTPLVLVGRDPDGEGRDYCVDNDHITATRIVLDHLHERGAHRIALLAGELGDAYTEDCVRSYREWCQERGVEPQAELVSLPLDGEGRAAIGRLLTGADRADGVYANLDVLGMATLRAAEICKLRVPEDLVVVVCTDRRTFDDVSVEPTTLELDPARTAVEAIDLLVELIKGRAPTQRQRVIPTRLVPRASTART
jgi:DNA-binding LacI/PurR family transcriptional regulator